MGLYLPFEAEGARSESIMTDWQLLTGHDFVHIWTPGSHFDMLRGGQVVVLADSIRQTLSAYI